MPLIELQVHTLYFQISKTTLDEFSIKKRSIILVFNKIKYIKAIN